MARTVLLVRLVIEGDPSDAVHVVDGLLDNGVFQDPINGHDADCGALKVLVADIIAPSASQEASGQRVANNEIERQINEALDDVANFCSCPEGECVALRGRCVNCKKPIDRCPVVGEAR